MTSTLLKIDKKSCKKNNIYYTEYITMKDFDYVNIHSVSTLYLIIVKVDKNKEEQRSIDKVNKTLGWY